MESKAISFGSTIRQAWSLFKAHWKYFLGFLLLITAVHGIGNTLVALLPASYHWLQWLLLALISIVYLVMNIGYVYAAVKAARGIPLSYSDLFGNYRKFFSYLFGTILYAIVVFVGLILFIIPGIIWGIKYSLWPYYVAEKGEGPIRALESSSAATKGFKWDLLLLYIGWFLVALLAMIPFILILGASGAGAALVGDFQSLGGIASSVGIALGALGAAIAGIILSIVGSLYFAKIYQKLDDRNLPAVIPK